MCNPVTHFRGLHTLCYLLLGGHSPKEQTDVFLPSLYTFICLTGLPRWFQQSSSKESACNAEDPGLIPGLERSPCMRKWQPTPIFLPRRSHGQRSLAGYSPWGHKELPTRQLSPVLHNWGPCPTQHRHLSDWTLVPVFPWCPRSQRQAITVWVLSWVQFSCSVVSDSLRPRGLQHARPPCPSPTPGVDSNSCPLSRGWLLDLPGPVTPWLSKAFLLIHWIVLTRTPSFEPTLPCMCLNDPWKMALHSGSITESDPTERLNNHKNRSFALSFHQEMALSYTWLPKSAHQVQNPQDTTWVRSILVVQWLRLQPLTAGVLFTSLVRELRSLVKKKYKKTILWLLENNYVFRVRKPAFFFF